MNSYYRNHLSYAWWGSRLFFRQCFVLRDATRLKPSAGLGETLADGITEGRLRVVKLTEPDIIL